MGDQSRGACPVLLHSPHRWGLESEETTVMRSPCLLFSGLLACLPFKLETQGNGLGAFPTHITWLNFEITLKSRCGYAPLPHMGLRAVEMSSLKK